MSDKFPSLTNCRQKRNKAETYLPLATRDELLVLDRGEFFDALLLEVLRSEPRMLQTLTGRHTIPAEGGGGATGLVGEETMMLGPVMVMDNGREVV